MNLGQAFGELLLRIDTLEEENAALRVSLGAALRRQPLPAGVELPKGTHRARTPARITEVLTAATARMTQKEIVAAMGDVKPMTVYMALRAMGMSTPPRVEFVGTGFNNEPYRYCLPGRFKDGA